MNEFQKENNFLNYLKKIKDLRDHIVVLAVKDTIGVCVKETGYAALRELGLQKVSENTEPWANHWRGYVAILYDQRVLYENLEEKDRSVSVEKSVEGIELEVFSSPLHDSNMASIIVDTGEYAVNGRGINIVIINTETREIMDSVCFDTHVERAACIRRMEEYEITIRPRERSKYFIRELNAVRNNLRVENIISDLKINSSHNREIPKIKVRIYAGGEYLVWNAIESVVQCFARDERYDCLVIVENARIGMAIAAYKSGVKSIRVSDYDKKRDNPDIIIYNSMFSFGHYVSENEKIKCFIPFGLIYGTEGGTGEVLERDINAYNVEWDAIIVDRPIYRLISAHDSEIIHNLFEFGNPKFDLIYRYVKQGKTLPEHWEKIRGKKAILWASDHIWNSANCTFDLYIRPFLDYFSKRTDIALIIRPHAWYFQELFTSGVWTQSDYAALKEFCNSTPNIIWDDSQDYGYAYSAASAVITDVNCGITVSALTLDVPLAVLYRYDGYPAIPQNPELIDSLYSIHNVEEAYAFIDSVVAGEDSKRELRQNIFDQYVASFDGKNGERIKEFIEKLYLKKARKC